MEPEIQENQFLEREYPQARADTKELIFNF